MNLKDALKISEGKFRNVGIKTAGLDALVLLAFILEKPKEYILTYPEIKLTKKQKRQFFRLVEKRKKRLPLAYILRYKEFFGRKFLVNENVLIPRPETEKIIELTIKFIKKYLLTRSALSNNKKWHILDLGTGSGCIAITLACELEKQKIKYQIIASDISQKALKIAKQNAKILKAKKINFVKSDLFKNIKGKFNLIVSNLPYVKKEEIKNELKFEPRLSLLDQKQIPQMLKQYKKHLKPNGILIYETINGKVKTINY